MMKRLLKQKPNYQTVFTYAEVAQITGGTLGENLIANINYYVRAGDLIRLSKGIYAIDKNYSRLEFANKLRTPSYISFYTVLAKERVIFQPYKTIFVASCRFENIEIANQKYKYRKIKDEILMNDLGLIIEDGVQFASLERALLDKIYLDGEEYFDNLRSVDWDQALRLNEIVYRSKKIEKYILDSQNA